MVTTRAVAYTDPKAVCAGSRTSYKFLFIPDISLPPKTILRFDMLHRGNVSDFELPTANLKEEKNGIWLTLADGKIVEGKQKKDLHGHPVFDFVLQKGIEAGEKLMFVVGSKSAEHVSEFGTKAPTLSVRKRPLHLYIDIKGKGDFSLEPYIFTIDIKGAELSKIRILAPSLVARNQRFDVVARFEDRFGNLTSRAPENTMMEFTYDRLRENLKILLFVPDSGFSVIPNLYLNENGVYRLCFRNTLTNEKAYSHPIVCQESDTDQAFYGQFTAKGEHVAIDEVESFFRKARDVQGLNFFSISPEDPENRTSNELWKEIATYTGEFNEEGRFATFLGFSYQTNDKTEGAKLIFHTKDNKPLYRQKETKSSTFLKIIKANTPKDLFAIAMEPTAKLHEEFEKGVLYSEQNEKAIFELIESGKRFSFIGLEQTAILAPILSRDSLITALEERKTFITSGPRMLASFNIATRPIGSILSLQARPGLQFVRHIQGYAACTNKIKELIIYRNAKPIYHLKNLDFYAEFEEYDESSLDEALSFEGPNGPFAYYHLKVIQEDGHFLITTPTIIEAPLLAEVEEIPAKKRKKG